PHSVCPPAPHTPVAALAVQHCASLASHCPPTLACPVPLEQVLLGPQFSQTAPALPQAVLSIPGWQTCLTLSQQPCGQPQRPSVQQPPFGHWFCFTQNLSSPPDLKQHLCTFWQGTQLPRMSGSVQPGHS